MANGDGKYLPPRMTEPPEPPPVSSGRRAGEDSDMATAIKFHANAIHHLAESLAELAKAMRGDESK